MTTTIDNDLLARQELMDELHHLLQERGMNVRLRRHPSGIPKLKVRSGTWTETVQCAGAEGVYAFVTAHGRLLGSGDELRTVADIVQFMATRRQR
ncbi:hypothetical protein EDD29_5738 [Actinocorallia herbida]|uniref:Uncharacterized protein n=1 Tax=Actinocorallia herbida TaxID=58109 RepID=A0A3N1D3I3_9ACTN|nr:hypothetical protein [Actinocorallia herbida]ROO88081.1 hypothetical protein EDD29_5738 [Actinocorallia herbida]